MTDEKEVVISLKIYLNFAESILILADLLLLTILSQRTIVLFGYPVIPYQPCPTQRKDGTNIFRIGVVGLEVEIDLFGVVGKEGREVRLEIEGGAESLGVDVFVEMIRVAFSPPSIPHPSQRNCTMIRREGQT